MQNKVDGLKYYKTPLTGEAKKRYDKNWDLIFKNERILNNNKRIQKRQDTGQGDTIVNN